MFLSWEKFWEKKLSQTREENKLQNTILQLGETLDNTILYLKVRPLFPNIFIITEVRWNFISHLTLPLKLYNFSYINSKLHMTMNPKAIIHNSSPKIKELTKQRITTLSYAKPVRLNIAPKFQVQNQFRFKWNKNHGFSNNARLRSRAKLDSP